MFQIVNMLPNFVSFRKTLAVIGQLSGFYGTE